MDFIDHDLRDYSEKFTSPENEVLADLNRNTNAKVLYPQMLAGHLQGRVLSMLSHMIKPKRVLEIGTFTGYSAICFAEGLAEGGMVHTIDINEELEPMVADYIKRSNFQDKITQHIGNALDIIPTMDETFDMAYLDADKINYDNYFDLVYPKMRKGGWIITDNILWSGKVLKDREGLDKDTVAIKDFTERLHNDDRLENVVLPIRDGIYVARVK
ncbi:MAG: caffeoyl-CoA O-methyltransferase [Sphingobacteriales bacterium]|jgi:caffeoyl-CoA O-methyltransferase